MKLSRIALVGLLFAGLLVLADQKWTLADDVAGKIARKPGDVWTYTVKYKEVATANKTEGEKTTAYVWEFNKTSEITVYFKSVENGMWSAAVGKRDIARELKSYKVGDADKTAERASLDNPIGAPSLTIVKADAMGNPTVEKADETSLVNTAIASLRGVNPNEFKDGLQNIGVAKVGGANCSYTLTVKADEKVKGAWLVEGEANATIEGEKIALKNYKGAWMAGESVPGYESFDLSIESTEKGEKTTTVTTVTRNYTTEKGACKTLGEKEIAAINEQLKKWEAGQPAMKASNLTAGALFAQPSQVKGEKVVEAGNSFYAALQQWPDGPFAQYIEPWFWNINALTNGKILQVEIGKPVPSMRIAKWYNTEPLSENDLHGKVVVIDVFQTWCGPCMGSVPHLIELQKKFKEKGLVVIGLSTLKPWPPQPAMSIEDMIKQLKADYPIACDDEFNIFDMDGKIIRHPQVGLLLGFKTQSIYPGNSIPRAYIIDRNGVLQWAGFPTDPNSKFDETIEKLLEEGKE